MRYINKKFTIEKVSVQNIAKKYGTPAYCYSYKQLKENINSLEKKDTQIPNLDEFAIPVNDYWSTRSLLNWN